MACRQYPMNPRHLIGEALQKLRRRAGTAYARQYSSCRHWRIIILSNLSQIGMRQTFSPRHCQCRSAGLPACHHWRTCRHIPAPMQREWHRSSRQINHKRGLNLSCVYHMASASTRRPSASVFKTSIVCPDIDVTISPGFWALPSGIFSTSPITPTTLALFAGGKRVHQAGNGGRAAHIALHVFHAGRRLDRNTARVETNTLADKASGFLVGRTLPLHHDHLAGCSRPARHPARSPCRVFSSAPRALQPSHPAW